MTSFSLKICWSCFGSFPVLLSARCPARRTLRAGWPDIRPAWIPELSLPNMAGGFRREKPRNTAASNPTSMCYSATAHPGKLYVHRSRTEGFYVKYISDRPMIKGRIKLLNHNLSKALKSKFQEMIDIHLKSVLLIIILILNLH